MCNYMTSGEKSIVSKIIQTVLNNNHTVSVYDSAFGEGEWTVKRSGNFNEIMESLASTEGDVIRIRDKEGNVLGSITLIYGNAPDGSEVTADCTDNSYMLALCDIQPVWKIV